MKSLNSSARSLTFVLSLRQQVVAKENAGNKIYISFMSGNFVSERPVLTNIWLIPVDLRSQTHVKRLLLLSDFDKNWN